MKIGCHVSIAGSVDLAFERAKNLGCNTFQIFTKNSQMLQDRYNRAGHVGAGGGSQPHPYRLPHLVGPCRGEAQTRPPLVGRK